MDITPIRPGTISQDDIRETLKGLSPGLYTSRDLYDRYFKIMVRQNRTGVGRRQFGMALRAAGHVPSVVYATGGAQRVWDIKVPPGPWTEPAS